MKAWHSFLYSWTSSWEVVPVYTNFTVFDLTLPIIEPDSTDAVADALSNTSYCNYIRLNNMPIFEKQSNLRKPATVERSDVIDDVGHYYLSKVHWKGFAYSPQLVGKRLGNEVLESASQDVHQFLKKFGRNVFAKNNSQVENHSRSTEFFFFFLQH